MEYITGKYKNGIGDYVHARMSNYMLYGINSSDKKNASITAVKALRENHKRLQQLIKSNNRNIEVQQIEDYLNGIFYYKENPNNRIPNADMLNSQYAKQASEELEKYLNKRFSTLKADLQTLTFDTNVTEIARKTKYTRNLTNSDNKNFKTEASIRASTLQKISNNLSELTKAIDEVKNKIKKGPKVNELLSIKKQCDQYISDIAKVINSSTEKTFYVKFNSQKTDLGELLSAINTFVSSNFIPTTKDIGDLGEIGMAVALGVASSVKNQSLKTLLKGVVGDKKTPLKFGRFSNHVYIDQIVSDFNNLTDIQKEKTKINNVKYYKYDADTGAVYSVRGSNNTVDIDIKVDADSYLNKIAKVNNLKASVKNYSSLYNTKGIGVINDTHLEAILELASTDFINHYLNRLVFYSNTANDIYTEEVKWMTAIRGLSGTRWSESKGTEYSDCFIVNSKKDKHIYVFDTRKLLLILDKCADAITISTLPDNGHFKILNKWIGTTPDYKEANKRITNVISGLHSYKMRAAINFNNIPENYIK